MKSIAIGWVTPTTQMGETRNAHKMPVLQGKRLLGDLGADGRSYPCAVGQLELTFNLDNRWR
jgi:hypothetical protein